MITRSTMEKETAVTDLPHIVFLTSPGLGHLIPFAELATRLVSHHGFSATFLTFTNFSSPIQSNLLASLHPNISTVYLPLIPLDDIPTDAHFVTILATLFARSVPHVRDALVSLKQRIHLVGFVPDLFGTDLLPIAKELSVPPYIFFSCTCMSLLFFFHFPSLHTTTTCEYRDLPEPFHLPGCIPLPGKDFIDPVMDRKKDLYSWILQVMRAHTSAQGILVNSFETLEPGASKALQNEEKHPPVYLVGPFIRSGLDEADELGCLQWLDQQPNSSVLFVSFGSGGTLSMKQATELAFGLEASGHRFLWVIRCPSDSDTSATYFNLESPDDPLNYLPDGFVNQNKNKGMVVPSWAPQIKILSHKATGGFLSHCGWNSVLESVGHGVPLIAWPLYAEQRMNALMLVDGAGIAVRPVAREDGVVERDEIARIVLELMDGERGNVARRKVKELQEAGISALSPEGSSQLALTNVANEWKDRCN